MTNAIGARVREIMATATVTGAARAHASAAGRGLIEPHGGELVNLMIVDEKEKARAIASCDRALELSDRNACDVELLSVGGFSPLRGFMNEDV